MKKIKHLKRKIFVSISSFLGCGMLVSCYGMTRDESEYIYSLVMYGSPVVQNDFIDGVVYDDKNENDRFDAGEGISGIQFKLSKDGKVEKTDVTDENGEFNFEYVSGQNGSLELEFTDPNGLYESQKKEISSIDKKSFLEIELKKNEL